MDSGSLVRELGKITAKPIRSRNDWRRPEGPPERKIRPARLVSTPRLHKSLACT